MGINEYIFNGCIITCTGLNKNFLNIAQNKKASRFS